MRHDHEPPPLPNLVGDLRACSRVSRCRHRGARRRGQGLSPNLGPVAWRAPFLLREDRAESARCGPGAGSFRRNGTRSPDAPETKPAANLPAEKRRGSLERSGGLASLPGIAERGVEDARHLEVARDLYPGQRDEADARITHIAAGQYLAQVLADLVPHAIRTVSRGHSLVQGAARSGSGCHALPSRRLR